MVREPNSASINRIRLSRGSHGIKGGSVGERATTTVPRYIHPSSFYLHVYHACDSRTRIESQAGFCSSNGENGLECARFAYRIVLFYRNIRSGRAFRLILPGRLPRGAAAPASMLERPPRHFRRDCRKDQDKVISYFRLCVPPASSPVLSSPSPLVSQYSNFRVIDGPWRERIDYLLVRKITPDSAFPRVTAQREQSSKYVRRDIRLAARERGIFGSFPPRLTISLRFGNAYF